MVIYKSQEEIQILKRAGMVVAQVFDVLKEHITPGISTFALDQIVEQTIREAGAIPGFLHYGSPPFPGSACISINEEVVHGIPRKDRFLQDGDIVSIDVGSIVEGFYGDACRTFLCGDVAKEHQDLVRVTEEAFWHGFREAQIGKRLGDISAAVQAHCEKHGYGVIRELTGHGIGRDLHEAPSLFNYGTAGTGLRLQEGLCLALEPMVSAGGYQIRLLSDQWTYATQDGSYASHYENSFAITREGPYLLTMDEADKPAWV